MLFEKNILAGGKKIEILVDMIGYLRNGLNLGKSIFGFNIT
jgi:hypothetical protein